MESAGLRLMVRVVPGARQTVIEGVETAPDGRSHLRVRLAARPVAGAANAALIALLAGALGVRASAIEIRAGGTARIKRLFIAGDPETLLAAIAARVAGCFGQEDDKKDVLF